MLYSVFKDKAPSSLSGISTLRWPLDKVSLSRAVFHVPCQQGYTLVSSNLSKRAVLIRSHNKPVVVVHFPLGLLLFAGSESDLEGRGCWLPISYALTDDLGPEAGKQAKETTNPFLFFESRITTRSKTRLKRVHGTIPGENEWGLAKREINNHLILILSHLHTNRWKKKQQPCGFSTPYRVSPTNLTFGNRTL